MNRGNFGTFAESFMGSLGKNVLLGQQMEEIKKKRKIQELLTSGNPEDIQKAYLMSGDPKGGLDYRKSIERQGAEQELQDVVNMPEGDEKRNAFSRIMFKLGKTNEGIEFAKRPFDLKKFGETLKGKRTTKIDRSGEVESMTFSEGEDDQPKTLEQILAGKVATGKLTLEEAYQQKKASQPAGSVVNVNTGVPLNTELQKKAADVVMANYDKLKDVPQQINNLEKAKALIPEASVFIGPFGKSKLAIVKFARTVGIGQGIEGVKNAEELKTRLFQNILDNLKKMDAQPSQLQQQIMMEALGSLETDPQALVRVIDAYEDVLKNKVTLHNKMIEGMSRNIQWPINPKIEMEMPTTSGKQEWIENGVRYRINPATGKKQKWVE